LEVIIFGGSFDPIHNGHLEIIDKLKYLFPNKKIFIIPTFQNPIKDKIYASPTLRLKWIENVLQKKSNIIIESYELHQNKPSFTYKTIKYLIKNYKIEKIDFVIGQDNLANLDKWYKIKELKKMLNFIIVSRGDNNNNFDIKVCNNANSSDVRNKKCYKHIPNQIKKEVKEFYENNKRKNE